LCSPTAPRHDLSINQDTRLAGKSKQARRRFPPASRFVHTGGGLRQETAMDRIADVEELRELYGAPSERAVKKQLDRLDRHCRAFIALSPFLVVASADPAGHCDASPKGDMPGFVRVLDDRTLLIPDRLGNNRVDTLGNLLARPGIGLLFFVPGVNETLRVNGRASLTTDPEVLMPLAVNGKAPRSGILVAVEEVYFHCGKALIRSDLWNPGKRVPRGAFPSLGRILAEQIGGLSVEESERMTAESYRTRLY
jgi:PPOX class probable FMN-dependent enzyme